MALTVTTDNYSSINTCENSADWTGETPADVTDFYKEGTQCVGFTVRGSGNNDIYITGSWDLSGTKHFRFWMMTVAITELNYVELYLSDGTNTGYYRVLDAADYPGGWLNIVIDLSRAVDSGTKPTMTAVTTIGIRFNHTGIAKNAQNTWIDFLHYNDGLIAYGYHDTGAQTIAVAASAGTFTRSSGSYLTDGFLPGHVITTSGFSNAGNNTTKIIDTVTATVITVTDNSGLVDESPGSGDEEVEAPFTLEDILIKDENTTNGWGLIRKISGVYYLVGSITFGDNSGSNESDFLDASQIVVFEDRKVDSDLYDFTVVGNATGSKQKFQMGDISAGAGISGCVVKSEGSVKYDFDCTDTDVDDFKLYGCTFIDGDTFSFPATGSGRSVRNCVFEACGKVTVSTCEVRDCNFVSATDDAITVSSTSFDVEDCNFINPTNHGIEFTTAGTYDLVGITFSGTGASGPYDTENTTAGTVTVNNDINSNATHSEDTGGGSTIINSMRDMDVHVEDEDGNDLQGIQIYIQKTSPTAFTSDAGNNGGDADFIVNEVVDTDIPQTGWLHVWSKSKNAVTPYRYASWTSKTFSLRSELTGSATSAGTSTRLISTSTNFLTADIEEGDTIRNTSDNSWAVVDKIVDADNLDTSPLQDGTDDTWENGDGFSVHRLAFNYTDNDDEVDIPLMNMQTDSNGDVTKQYNYSTDLAIRVRIRQQQGATKYLPYKTSGTITNSGYNLTAILAEDEVAA